MATTTYGASGLPQTVNQCLDPAEIDSWLDFNALQSPNSHSSLHPNSARIPSSAMPSPTSTIVPLDMNDDHQTPVAPSHEYQRFKQQTGLPSGAMANLRALSESSQSGSFFGGYNTGIDDFGMSTSMYDAMGSNSGFDSMSGDLGIDMDFSSSSLPAFFFPAGEASQSDDFVDPTAIVKQEEAQANIRFYPGMHQQQAAMAKAQAEAQQQRKQQTMLQHQKPREGQPRQHPRRSAAHLPIDARTEETIARVVNQIRQNSTASAASDAASPTDQSVLPHVVRSRKDEDDMDEDERLLNSEEGKKLSSKERRQLRNKVSARAFRSRRKEYITQLEGEVAAKVSEANDLKVQNRALMEENARFRTLAEKLLRHPAFHPFLDELSRDPELAQSLSEVVQPSGALNTNTNEYASQGQQHMPPPQSEDPHIGMVLLPEPQLDLASLSLGNNWGVPSMGMPTFQQPQVFAVLELPAPAQSLDLETMSGKGIDSFMDRWSAEEDKSDTPGFSTPIKAEQPAIEDAADEPAPHSTFEFDENDDTVTLYATSRSVDAALPTEPITADRVLEKPKFELFITTDAEQHRLNERLQKMMAKMETSFNRISAMTSRLQL